jgi:ElaB/YqjD/DUF883 family membrane-anchored ribosome-binding protein
VLNAFNSAVKAFEGFFSKLFWFGVFLPVALFATLHLGLATLTFNGVWKAVSGPITETGWLAGAIIGLIVLAFLISPLLPLLRGLLDGSLLPAWLCTRLVKLRVKAVQQRRAALQETLDTAGGINQLAGKKDRMQAAYTAGAELLEAGNEAVITEAEKAVTAADALLRHAKLPDLATLEAAIAAVEAAFGVNNPDQKKLRTLKPNAAPAELELAKRTGAAGDALETVLRNAADEAAGRYEAAKERLRGVPTDVAVQATRMGDARRAAERYAMDAYGVEFAFLRPRLLIHVPKDNSLVAERLTAAQAALDSAVMAVFLACTLFVWLPLLAVYGHSVPVLLLVAFGAPLLVWGGLGLVVEAQFGLGEAFNLAVDRHRFDVLRELRQPIPASRSAERALWMRLAEAEADHRLAELYYVPEKAG